MQEILNKVKDFADKSHGNQLRKYTPDRYIVHPVRVMEICSEYTSELPVLAAALLHDVLEDTPVTPTTLSEFLLTVMSPTDAGKTMQLTVELTDVYVRKNYPQWNRRTRKAYERTRMEQISADAQTIKYADILDNCLEIPPTETDFAEMYMRESRQLLKSIPKGHQKLYEKALSAVH